MQILGPKGLRPALVLVQDALCELGKGASQGESSASAPRLDPGLGE